MIAIDFETFYDRDYSLSKMSTWSYVFDKRFDAYLVAAHNDKVHWVGHPTKFDWNLIDREIVVMHNASFDSLVIKRLQRDGIIPKHVEPAGYFDTADLAAYLSVKRDLKSASKYLLGIDVNKGTRTAMRGKTYSDARASGMGEELLRYGGADAENSYNIAKKYADQWPAVEQELSRLNREAGVRGVMLNRKLVEQGLETLRRRLFEAIRAIPWVADGEKPLSPSSVRRQGRIDGIPVPASLAKDDPEVIAWEKEYGPTHPWIGATRAVRSINMHLKRVEALFNGLRDDDTMAYQIKYFGANTGRFSGGGSSGGKFNMQNMPREAMFGVDLRPMLVARPGHKFVIADYSQIEARMLLWLVGDKEFLDLIATEGNIYQAYAKRAWGREIKKGTEDYRLAKAQCLGLGYQCGPPRFKDLASAPPYNLDLSMEEAERSVQMYRANSPLVVAHWRNHQKWLNISAIHQDECHEVELVSGRSLRYWEPRKDGRDIYARHQRGDTRRKIHSGVLTNNEIQAIARDILRDAWVALDKAGHRVVWSVHDELILEVPEDSSEEAAKDIANIMVSSSPWAKGCPIDVELEISDYYMKG